MADSGSGMRTVSSASAALAQASLADIEKWRRSGPVRVLPIESMGWSEDMGSWKTMASSVPRSSCIERRWMPTSSRPS